MAKIMVNGFFIFQTDQLKQKDDLIKLDNVSENGNTIMKLVKVSKYQGIQEMGNELENGFITTMKVK